MKELLFVLLLTLSITTKAQKLTGLWYSTDSTRVYEIKQTGNNKFEAVIQSSTRKNDTVGFVVIKELEYNNHKKRYEGLIYAVSDNQPTFVKIKFSKKEDKIILKLSRMFILDISTSWIRVGV